MTPMMFSFWNMYIKGTHTTWMDFFVPRRKTPLIHSMDGLSAKGMMVNEEEIRVKMEAS